MNVATIDMPIDKAREAMAEYRRAVKARHNEEDAAILRGYREIVRGRRIINILDVLKNAGTDHNGRPLLAICRADYQRVWFRHDAWFCQFTYGARSVSSASRRQYLSIPLGTVFDRRNPQHSVNASAMVPLIPPALRPDAKLDRYHILWEADWEAVPIDPFLLRHLGGPLYSILAQWDLTPVERAVLALRPRN